MNSIRSEYESQGVEEFYKNHGGSYVNPHVIDVHSCITMCLNTWKPEPKTILDLACGSGEATAMFPNAEVTGVDPYTGEAYLKWTGKTALPYSFDDVINGALQDKNYDLIVCSYAMHLLEISKLPALCFALAQISKKMLIISPHKKPEISWAWSLKGEVYISRTRGRYYEALG